MNAGETNIMVLVAASSINTGPVKGIIQFIKNISAAGIKFHMFNFWRHKDTNVDPFCREISREGIDCKLLRMGRRNYLLMVADAIRAVRKSNIDIIQTHGFKPSFVGLFVKYICKIKWVCFMHGTTSENYKVKCYHFLDTFFQHFADHVVLVSESQRLKIPGGKNPKRISVIHNAIDVHAPVRFNESLGPVRSHFSDISEDATLLVVVGRLSHEKGLDVFMEAFSIAIQTNEQLYAVIVGDGPERESLMAQARKLNLSSRVHFSGHTTTPGNYMAESDIVVLPSRSEGIPNVALEAMALGKPVVSTAVGGVPEVIEDGVSGLLIPSEEPEVMAQAILRLANDSGLATQISHNGLLRVQKYFSVEGRCNKIVGLYENLLQ